MTTAYRKLALLTDAEAELCLNGLLKGLTIRNPEYSELLVSPTDMAKVVNEIAINAGTEVPGIGEATPEKRPYAIRSILVLIAEDEELSPKLNAWLDNVRPTLLEPVTTSLVLAGIIFALSTHVKFDYEKEGSKKKLKISVEKKPTTETLIAKLFKFFK